VNLELLNFQSGARLQDEIGAGRKVARKVIRKKGQHIREVVWLDLLTAHSHALLHYAKEQYCKAVCVQDFHSKDVTRSCILTMFGYIIELYAYSACKYKTSLDPTSPLCLRACHAL